MFNEMYRFPQTGGMPVQQVAASPYPFTRQPQMNGQNSWKNPNVPQMDPKLMSFMLQNMTGQGEEPSGFQRFLMNMMNSGMFPSGMSPNSGMMSPFGGGGGGNAMPSMPGPVSPGRMYGGLAPYRR